MAKQMNLPVWIAGRSLAVISAMVLACSSVFADTMLEFRNQSAAPGTAGASSVSVYVSERFVRINEEEDSWTLYDRDADTVYVIDEKQREYTPLDRTAIAALGKQMSAARAEVAEQIKKMSPEQRAMVEQMVGHPIDAEPKPTKYESTGERRTVNGYDCTAGRLVRNGQVKEEFCTAQPRAIGMSASEYDAVQGMYSIMAELQEASGFTGGVPSYDQLNGLPIEIKSRDGSSQVISRVSHAEINDDVFRLPEGYKRVSPAGSESTTPGSTQTLR